MVGAGVAGGEVLVEGVLGGEEEAAVFGALEACVGDLEVGLLVVGGDQVYVWELGESYVVWHEGVFGGAHFFESGRHLHVVYKREFAYQI